MQKVWIKPEVESLEISMTLAGPGLQFVDQNYQDEDETGVLHHS
ncbi:hypothetical protein PAECIP111891_03099 [Paenibacillus allorhizoplanae]|uniref:Paeninodin family lasso peptide n=1 Tax=Paenibacillus allorhizoplanae TaxID=2905648 RepID=A0ABN8GHN3_9BACL|nr:paeninodin family lasso peptide [Paenibacillus allorhizoplanae]CAH1207790.1 hypothetical protein PAECIP111891_03099 [Paenibacillus allorhizoplanae]